MRGLFLLRFLTSNTVFKVMRAGRKKAAEGRPASRGLFLSRLLSSDAVPEDTECGKYKSSRRLPRLSCGGKYGSG